MYQNSTQKTQNTNKIVSEIPTNPPRKRYTENNGTRNMMKNNTPKYQKYQKYNKKLYKIQQTPNTPKVHQKNTNNTKNTKKCQKYF